MTTCASLGVNKIGWVTAALSRTVEIVIKQAGLN